MWIGFGQTVSKQHGAYDRATYSPIQSLSTASCPEPWMNFTQPEPTVERSFPHLPVYDISYMWFSAIACILTFLIGAIFSLAKPMNHRSLNKDLISPAFPQMFFWAPKKLRKKIYEYFSEIGKEHKEVNQS